MSVFDRLSRAPRAYDPELGAEAAAGVPDLTGDAVDLVSGAAGSSPFLKGLITREAAWLPAAMDGPDAAVAAEMAACGAAAPDALATTLRQAKRRIALLTALADLGGVWSLDKIMRVLTDFADHAIDCAMRAELARLTRRDKIPALIRDDAAGYAGMFVLAMGKMGAYELNYSSDIDLICLFDDSLFSDDDVMAARQSMVRVTRAMTAILSDRTQDGYVFRTDLRLRPDPSVTPVCMSMSAAEQYYESFGRTWERSAMIKARPAAGDVGAGDRFLDALRPFIWRRHLDFAAIEDAHSMRRRIRDTKRLHGPIDVPGHDMKLGQGGIREIEFFAQTRQLIAGGRDPNLRMRGTQDALTALAEAGWIPHEVAAGLTAHYRAFREVEHRIQMVNDAQTHKVPTSPEGIERIACLMGVDRAAFEKDVAQRLREVGALTEDFFAPDTTAQPEAKHAFDQTIIERWPHYPALRSERAARIFQRLKPDLLRRLSETAKPDEALVAFDRFLAGLPAGVQLLALFEANPDLVDLLIDIVGTAPALSDYLSRNSSVLDAVIGGDFFSPWPGAELGAQLAEQMARETDYETRLDTARRWKKEWHFRIGVHLLRGVTNAAEAGRQYAELADAVLSASWPVVVDEFARRHGPPPGRGAAILGMGSLGAKYMNANSDLDVIVIYDASGADMSEGRRPLASRTYYARLTQALITAMTAPMSQGRLYEIDMRLRPSGNQGPVATSWTAYQTYQRDEAWLWEHLALTRARVVVGPKDLSADIEDLRAEILAKPRSLGQVREGVAEMRQRLADAKTPMGVLDVRNGPGRMQDIELVAQAGHLLGATKGASTAAGLDGAVKAEWLSAEQAERLRDAHQTFAAVYGATRLLNADVFSDDTLGEGAARFLSRSADVADIDALRSRLTACYQRVGAIIEDMVSNEGRDDGA